MQYYTFLEESGNGLSGDEKQRIALARAFMKKRKIRIVLVLLLIFIGVSIQVIWGNKALELNEYQVKSEEIPEAFEGFCIAQISDLHNDEIGRENIRLLEMLKKAEPDIIVMTGDIIDSYHTDVEVSLQFVERAVEIAPCYYVTGNHESRLSKEVYLDFEEKMKSYGVNVLHDESVLIEKEGESISLAGMDDPAFASKYKKNGYRMSTDTIEGLLPNDGFQILLCHRPEIIPIYVEAKVDLVFTGHAHGGQFRLPFVGGVVAPNQGFFPQYDAGLFVEENTHMVVSRGIGNSLFPVRFKNRPEVVVVEFIK